MAFLWQTRQAGWALSKTSPNLVACHYVVWQLSDGQPLCACECGRLCTCSLGFTIHVCPEVKTCDLLRRGNVDVFSLVSQQREAGEEGT